MELEKLTPKLLESYLHAFRVGAEKPGELLDLHCIEYQAGTGMQERHFQLFDWLERLVLEQLTLHRQSQSLDTHSPNPSWRSALRQDFQNSTVMLQAWSALYHRYFLREVQAVDELSQVAGYDPRQFRRRLETGLKELCAQVQRREMQAHQRDKRASLGASIPAPEYAELFGVTAAKEQLQNWLCAADGPRMVSIEGLGGIGKTTLAQAVLQDVLQKDNAFHDILWISARQESLTLRGEIEQAAHSARTLQEIASELAQKLGLTHLTGLDTTEKLKGIQPLLNLHPHLVVIDNLETAQEVRAIVPALRKIAGQSRFLFTSRRTLGAYPYVQVFSVPELSAEDSRRLIESEVRRRGKPYTLEAEKASLIYETVGGLPLALKLIAAQIYDLSEEYALKRLSQVSPGRSARALYTYIYKQTWRSLMETSRQLLLSMLLVSPSGDSLEWIQTNSGLSAEDFEGAFAQLLDFSLVETNRTQVSNGYHLHRITQAFLKTNILQEWDL
ncbi:MAG: hypothetical protein HY869_24060 [Chloroflexi bacterium]|nr:hypothetical protein [Chloroflexota bacterium]